MVGGPSVRFSSGSSVLEIFLELLATVMVTMSELQANRLPIPHPHDFRRTSFVAQVEVTSSTR